MTVDQLHRRSAALMATVHLARDLRHHRPVALKGLHPELASSPGPDRFLEEALRIARETERQQ